ncbi:MAG TPA: GNAT family N-acetyltransferase [Bacilli bacterium]
MVIIKEVLTKKDLKKFIEFPVELYRDSPYFVPCLFEEEMENFNPKKNPAYEFCETRLFLAYKDNKIVGRIAGLISHAYNKKVNQKIMRFTRFDFIDDYEVSEALINKVKEWADERGMESMMGPIGFTDIDKQGMLVEGFKEKDLSITLYNYDYYPVHMDRLGFRKAVDWIEYQIFPPKELDPRIERISSMVQKRYGFHRLHFKKNKELYPYAVEAFKVINEAFAKLFGTVPLTDAIVQKSIHDYISKVNLDYVIVIANKEGEVIGFGLMVPSLAEALKKSKGHLFPFGVFRLLKALKTNKILEMYFIAVKPEYQNFGVNAVIMAEAVKAAIANGVEVAETGPELETNIVTEQWKSFPHRQHRRRRCYIKDFK